MNKFQIKRQKAQIISLKKYNQAFNFFFNKFCIDMTFQFEDKSTITTTIQDLNIPIQENQNIILIWVDNTLIAFEDTENNTYYYLSNDPTHHLNILKIDFLNVVFATLLLLMLVSVLTPNNLILKGLICLLPIIFRIYKLISSHFIQRKLDLLISN